MRALVVGAGFTGCTVARVLADDGWEVIICDRRDHVGGNAHDALDERGVLMHPYGPHIFHTRAPHVIDFLSRFTEWHPYEHRVTARVGEQYVPVPVNMTTVKMLCDPQNVLKNPTDVERFFEDETKFWREQYPRPRNSRESVLVRMGSFFYETIFAPYTIKQWGVTPEDLDAGVCARIPVRYDRDDRYFTDYFQSMPMYGYTEMFRVMLDHDSIHVHLRTEGRDCGPLDEYDEVVWTGPIDEFFGFQLGELPYRTATFEHRHAHRMKSMLVTPQVNYPSLEYPYTREYEVRQMTGQATGWTTLTRETPARHVPRVTEPMWPIPAPANRTLYKRYRELAEEHCPEVTFTGRLGSYKYLDMHQACAMGLNVAESILEEPRVRS